MKFLTNAILCGLLSLAVASNVKASNVDTVVTHSASMNKKIKAVVITPTSYTKSKQYPVVYLLHGYSGKYATWITEAPVIKDLADQHDLIIVCPDGANSWYWDSPIDDKLKYETYVAKELVSWVDSEYSTIKNKTGRGITGLSMGGHGGLYLGIKHQDVFGTAGSMSGGVDIRPFPNNWEMASSLGMYDTEPERWEKHTVVNMLHLVKPNSLSIIIDCGTEDFFFKVNEELHQQMLYRNIQHDYIVRPGAHNFTYWRNAVQYQILYMSNFFQKNRK